MFTKPKPTSPVFAIGMDRGLYTVPDDFNDPLPPDVLAAFYGDGGK